MEIMYQNSMALYLNDHDCLFSIIPIKNKSPHTAKLGLQGNYLNVINLLEIILMSKLWSPNKINLFSGSFKREKEILLCPQTVHQ